MSSNRKILECSILPDNKLEVDLQIPKEWAGDPQPWGIVLAEVVRALAQGYKKQHPSRKLKMIENRVTIEMSEILKGKKVLS